jgi:hypothetical protein
LTCLSQKSVTHKQFKGTLNSLSILLNKSKHCYSLTNFTFCCSLWPPNYWLSQHAYKNDTSQHVGKLNKMAQPWKRVQKNLHIENFILIFFSLKIMDVNWHVKARTSRKCLSGMLKLKLFCLLGHQLRQNCAKYQFASWTFLG